MKKGIKYDFSLLSLLLIPVGVSLNVVGYQLSTILKLPVFLDLIGTTLVAMIAGPWVGMVTGGLGNLINGMVNPTSIPFALVSMLVGLATGFFSRAKLFTNLLGTVVAGTIITAISASSAGIVALFVFGGISGASGTDFLTATFVAAGNQIASAVFSTNLISGTFNTIINISASMFLIKQIPDRYLSKLNYGTPYIGKKPLSKERV